MRPSYAVAALALALAAYGGSAAAPDPSVVAATKVNACVQAHGMSGPSDKLDPPAPTIRGESTTVFRSCEWPPPAYTQTGYAASSGYAEIRVTRVPWAEKAEVANASAPDRVESPCAEVELRYTFARQDPPMLQEPMRFASGTRALIGGQPFTDALPFRIAASDIVVVHNLSYSIAVVRCVR
ncbi:MAG TPA: hypothetical protein VGS17_00835 [Candidatus Limnocylindria bacterium]|nr:hypothetical protein [Candidatus Limnocylindria bacterium]